MDKELFEQLTQSMKEAIAISKAEMKPSRVFTVEPPADPTSAPLDNFERQYISADAKTDKKAAMEYLS
jgi:hypothetical protein